MANYNNPVLSANYGIDKYSTPVWLCLFNAHLLFDSDGQNIGIEGSLRDIDERKQSEIQLQKAKDKAEESDRLKSAFIQNISHEIRTPMNAIMGFTSLIGNPDTSSEMQSSFVKAIQKSSNQLLLIIGSSKELVLDYPSVKHLQNIWEEGSGCNLNQERDQLSFLHYLLYDRR